MADFSSLENLLMYLSTGGSLKGRNLSGMDLSNVDFRKAALRDLTDCDFSNCNLAGANFTDCILGRTTFNKSNLRGATFEKAKILACDLEEAAVDEKTSFKSVEMLGGSLEGTKGLTSDHFRDASVEKVFVSNGTYYHPYKSASPPIPGLEPNRPFVKDSPDEKPKSLARRPDSYDRARVESRAFANLHRT